MCQTLEKQMDTMKFNLKYIYLVGGHKKPAKKNTGECYI